MSCRGHRHPALIVRRASRTKPGGGNALAIAYERHVRGADASGPSRAEGPPWRRDGPLESMEGSNQAGGGHGPLGPMEGSNQAGAGMVRWTDGRSNRAGARHRPLGPMEGSDQAGAGKVRWIDGKVKPSWRTTSSVGPTERVRRPAPWFWWVVGRSDPLWVPRIQGTASGQQDDRFCPA